ncbi:MAG TPA: Rne/Rng family ribonuclease [Stellaceae bacterium]|nr:Rne/Rng family ribonuclease [Stellaceae bacterium]
MAKRMLIDSTHSEETRVVVLSGNRLEEFDFETSTKKQIKGNIYLAKVTRVEPSLQAAFVEYGGNRHGFLAFSEIHSDYYRIPVADRPADALPHAHRPFDHRSHDDDTLDAPEPPLLQEEIGAHPSEAHPEIAIDTHETGVSAAEGDASDTHFESEEGQHGPLSASGGEVETSVLPERMDTPTLRDRPSIDEPTLSPPLAAAFVELAPAGEQPPIEPATTGIAESISSEAVVAAPSGPETIEAAAVSETAEAGGAGHEGAEITPFPPPPEPVETIGGDEIEEASRQRARRYRPYKIQEVVKRRQVMLVQVTKEERGSKGAALTTYLSLAGRYCVLMPNTDRGGGVSRKITNANDRKRLKDLVEDLQVPEGMGIIVRTAGSERSKAEIKRDFEYLLRLWDEIRELTLKSTAPALIYEEGNLIKRSIRDLYTRDIDEVIVEGEEGYRNAKTFMRMLMPSHAKRVHHYRDPTIPLFQRFQVESQIDAIHSPIVQLRSGGYIVINQTEALVAIDVNSGRATRERNIEETALKTNCEAAEEIARQLRLRDLAGLIVIDFIDMEEHRNQVTVERRLKEAMKHDRARIQVGRISAFGLLEMSRQRLRPSIVEASTQPCPHCGGTGNIRSTESTALHVLRAIEEEGMRRRSAEISVAVPSSVSLYILNQKRSALAEVEHRYHFRVTIIQDDTLIPPNLRLDRVRAFTSTELSALPVPTTQPSAFVDDEEEEEQEEAITAEEPAEAPESPGEVVDAGRELSAHIPEPRHEGEEGHGSRRRRRRRRRRGSEHGREVRPTGEMFPEQGDEHPAGFDPSAQPVDAGAEHVEAQGEAETGVAPAHELAHAQAEPPGATGDSLQKRRRRGRRGGRRRRRGHGEGGQVEGRQYPRPGVEEEAGHAPVAESADRFSPPHEQPWLPPEETPTAAAMVGESVQAEATVAAPPEPISAPPEPRKAPAAERGEAAPAEPKGDGGAVNVPPPVTVTERPANPKRGWWHRLTQG